MEARRAWGLCLCGLLAATGAWSAEVYRWTDAQGRVFYGDRAPEERKASAKVVAIEQPPPVPAKVAAPPAASRRTAPASAKAQSPAPQPVQTAPALIGRSQALPPVESKEARCAAAWQRFDESSACFAPYRVDGGKVLAEAYDRCETVMMPSDCGVHPGQ
jgi:hypothetical protein